MHFANHNHGVSSRLARALAALSLAVMLLASPAAFALDSGDIVVSSIKGEVHIAVRGADTKLRAGSILELPATVRTGRDGAIELRQGATSISVGPDSLLEFPALATPGGSIDRVVQPRGTSFYNVGKRGGRKLRIETPFLVGVVKGTQFSVVAQDHATTISLFEGLLEVRSADDSDVIDLHAGEIASRDRAATDISVMKMEPGAAPPVQKAPATKSSAPPSNPARPASNVSGDPVRAGRNPVIKPGVSPVEMAPGVGVATSPGVPTGNGAVVDVDVETPADAVVPGVQAEIETPIVTSDVSVDLGGSAVVETTGDASVVDESPGRSEDAATTVDVGDGAATVDLGVNGDGVSVDVGVDLGTTTEVDLGLDTEDSDNSGPGNSGSDNSGSGSDNSGRGSDNSGGGSDNSGPGNATDVVDGVLDSLTRGKGGK
jgi:hypothetical protein